MYARENQTDLVQSAVLVEERFTKRSLIYLVYNSHKLRVSEWYWSGNVLFFLCIKASTSSFFLIKEKKNYIKRVIRKRRELPLNISEQ